MKTNIIALLATLTISSVAYSQPKTAVEALICDTEISVEALYTFHTTHPEASLYEGIKAINGLDKTANCDIISVVYEVGDIMNTIHIVDSDTDKYVDVRKLNLLAKCQDDKCNAVVEPTIAYSVFPVTPRT